MPDGCIFCSGGPLSEEDTYPKWLDDLRPPNASQIRVRRYYRGHRQPDRVRHFLRVPVRAVCVTCNTGWMSRLERRAGPILTPMIRQHRVGLSLEAQRIVASWLSLRAMVLEWGERSGALMHYTQEERSAFMDTLEPPAETFAWLAHYNGPSPAWLCQLRSVFPFSDSLEVPGQVLTITIYKLALQNLCLRPSALSYTPDPEPRGNQAAIQIWPPERVQIWPPPKHLNDEVIKAFGERWGDPVEGDMGCPD